MNIKNTILIAAGSAVLAMLFTVSLYRPAGVMLYHMREPYYRYPIRTTPGKPILIREDAYGSGDYGTKRSGNRIHDGIDFLAKEGEPVLAAKSGIAFRLNVPTGHGKYVMIYHPDGDQTIYSHLCEYNIISTQRVKRGDIIGYVGKTGNADVDDMHAHLHFEIRKHAVCVDPKPYLRR